MFPAGVQKTGDLSQGFQHWPMLSHTGWSYLRGRCVWVGQVYADLLEKRNELLACLLHLFLNVLSQAVWDVSSKRGQAKGATKSKRPL